MNRCQGERSSEAREHEGFTKRPRVSLRTKREWTVRENELDQGSVKNELEQRRKRIVPAE